MSKQENKYEKLIIGKGGKGCIVDVYDVLKAFNVTDPALQHLAKKALCAGLRGHKNREQDLIDIQVSIDRALEMEAVENAYHSRNEMTASTDKN